MGARLFVVFLTLCLPAAAGAFYPQGHDYIEATAYRRLMATRRVEGAGVSGRELLGRLVAWGILFPPRCFEDDPSCDDAARRETPLAFWPPVHSGGIDMLLNRQLDAQGQCQHFMAQTADTLDDDHPRAGVPKGLAVDAPRRCLRILSSVLDGVLRDPAAARDRLLGVYTLLHAIEDAFSDAHVERDARRRIHHLRSWKLLDWPAALIPGDVEMTPETHHDITDHRDEEFLEAGARTEDGTRCADVANPYALPERCLNRAGREATAAVVDLLVLIYRVKARAEAEGREATLDHPKDAAAWRAYVDRHLPLAFAEPDLEPEPGDGLVQPDFMLGLRTGFELFGDPWSVGLAAAGTITVREAVPFVLRPLVHAGYERHDGEGGLRFGGDLGLHLPALGTFSLGVTPVAVDVACRFGDDCAPDVQAAPFVLTFRLVRAVWAEIEGPRWSWAERRFRDPDVRLTLGWFTDLAPSLGGDAPDPAGWRPPPLDAAGNFRQSTYSAQLFAGSTLASDGEDDRLALGATLRWDRDRWGRRAGLAPGAFLEGAHGETDGRRGFTAAFGPTLHWFYVPNGLSASVAPATVRVGALDDRFDVAGALGLAAHLNGLEVALESPPLSYVSRARWRRRPLALRLGLAFDF